MLLEGSCSFAFSPPPFSSSLPFFKTTSQQLPKHRKQLCFCFLHVFSFSRVTPVTVKKFSLCINRLLYLLADVGLVWTSSEIYPGWRCILINPKIPNNKHTHVCQSERNVQTKHYMHFILVIFRPIWHPVSVTHCMWMIKCIQMKIASMWRQESTLWMIYTIQHSVFLEEERCLVWLNLRSVS